MLQLLPLLLPPPPREEGHDIQQDLGISVTLQWTHQGAVTGLLSPNSGHHGARFSFHLAPAKCDSTAVATERYRARSARVLLPRGYNTTYGDVEARCTIIPLSRKARRCRGLVRSLSAGFVLRLVFSTFVLYVCLFCNGGSYRLTEFEVNASLWRD